MKKRLTRIRTRINSRPRRRAVFVPAPDKEESAGYQPENVMAQLRSIYRAQHRGLYQEPIAAS